MSDARKYKLGPGGVYGRFEDGQDKIYQPGDVIWATAEQAKGESLKGRLLPWGAADEELEALQQVQSNLSKALQTVSTAVPVDNPLLPSRAEGDFAFIHNLPAADVIMRIREMDDSAQLGALADTEKLHPSTKGGRRSVLNEVAKRKRQLALANARARKAALKAAAEVAKE